MTSIPKLTYRISAIYKVGRTALVQAEGHYDALLIAAALWAADIDDVDAELASQTKLPQQTH